MTATKTCAVPSVPVEISPGELIDKITILEVKVERISDPARHANVRHELGVLRAVRDEVIPPSAALHRLAVDLKAVNIRLWDVEDALRDCERNGRFDDRFITLARAVYRTNDRRAALKAQINALLGATVVEEKSYAAY